MARKMYTVSNFDNVPMIRLTGKWLKERGINIGDKLEFIEGKNMIILSKVSQSELDKINKQNEVNALQKRLNQLG